MADTWQTNKLFPETNMRMLDDEILCDVTFLMGESKQPVKAHKFILASRSPVFYAMFCGPLAESSEAIQIPDIDADVFKLLLQYMYTAKCEVTPEVVMSLLYAANKYDVLGVASECRTFLESNMTPDNVCTILQQAHMLNDKPLINISIYLLITYGLESEGFLSLSLDILKIILQSESLPVDEVDLYTACVKWAEEECRRLGQDVTDANCRAALGDALMLIRFPLMSVQTFASRVSERDILTSPEKISLFQYLANKNEKPNVSAFSATPRSSKINKICRFKVSIGPWTQDGSPHALSFSCSKYTFLLGAGLYTPTGEGTVQGELKVTEGDTVLMSQNVTLPYEEGVRYTDVKFHEPVRIRRDTLYTITQTFQGVATYYGSNGRDSVSKGGLNVKFQNFDDTNATTVSEGQFRHLCFSI